MGGGASTFKMQAGGNPPERSSWIGDPTQRILPLSQDKFKDITGIGKGKFGHVFLSSHKTQEKHIAIKYISKEFVRECKSVDRIRQEIELIQKIDHPYIVHCYGGFDTPACIAMCFEYCIGGELFTRMKKVGKFYEQHAKFYFCEMALALNYLHNTLGYVYRDLKPENVLIDHTGHCKLCDFGFAVPVHDNPLFDGCGTAMYVAPEIASGFKQAHGFPVDWWSLGCVLAEMITGNAPFGDTDNTSKFEIFTNITEKSPFLTMTMSKSSKQLILGLLNKNQKQRWDWDNVKSSDFCADVDWDDVASKSIAPPWIPKTQKNVSTENFVSWNEMVVPKAPASSTANGYCAVLMASFKGGCRTSNNANGVSSFTATPVPSGTRSRTSSDASPTNIPNQTLSGRSSPSSTFGTPVQSQQGRKSLKHKSTVGR